MPKEIGIIMSGSHPVDILDGRKTMTRRVVTKNSSIIGEGGDWAKLDFEGKSVYKDSSLGFDFKWLEIERHACLPWVDGKSETGQYLHVPYNWSEDMTVYRVYSKLEVGSRLWVKETWAAPAPYDALSPSGLWDKPKVWYLADGPKPVWAGRTRSALFMPRWTSRITLEITELKAERVDQISYDDAKAEGCISISDFAILWNSINGKRGYLWNNGNWVWSIRFLVR